MRAGARSCVSFSIVTPPIWGPYEWTSLNSVRNFVEQVIHPLYLCLAGQCPSYAVYYRSPSTSCATRIMMVTSVFCWDIPLTLCIRLDIYEPGHTLCLFLPVTNNLLRTNKFMSCCYLHTKPNIAMIFCSRFMEGQSCIENFRTSCVYFYI